MMDRDFTIFLLVGTCIVNGIFSPAVLWIWSFAPAWYPSFVPFTPDISFYATSLICATLTLMFSGVFAALFERISGRQTTDQTTMLIWFLAAAGISVPAFGNLAGSF